VGVEVGVGPSSEQRDFSSSVLGAPSRRSAFRNGRWESRNGRWVRLYVLGATELAGVASRSGIWGVGSGSWRFLSKGWKSELGVEVGVVEVGVAPFLASLP
jgi:hypothetical protein